MWQSVLSKASAIKLLDFDTCDMENRQQFQPSISFESACKSNARLLDLSSKTIKQIDAMQNCFPGQFTKTDHLKAAFSLQQ